MAGVRIVRGGAELVPSLEPLTRSLHAHHITVDPGVPGIPPRDLDSWWRIRSARYREWLADPDAFVLLAEPLDHGAPVGYALVVFHTEDDSHTTGERFAELESLAVLPAHRGQGIGTLLLREVYRHVRVAGVEEMVIGVLATNDAAMRMYRREGFVPWVVTTMGKVPPLDA